MTNRRISGLYAITPDTEDSAILLLMVSAALRGGARVVQYRNKSASQQQRYEQCNGLAKLLREHDGLLIVNDDPNLAAEVGAGGVHLGRHDSSIPDARKQLGAKRLIGVSCYDDLERARAAVAAGADYVAFGSFFRSATKPEASTAPISILHRAKAELDVPVVAIGGINSDNAGLLIEAGADAVAMLGALFGAMDIEAQACSVSALFTVRDHRVPV